MVGRPTSQKMRTDINVYCLAGDVDGGCGFYRIREPARVAALEGVDVSVHTDIPVDAEIRRDGSSVIHSIHVSPDVIVFQRPLMRTFVELIVAAQQRGIACIVELDDDLVGTHPDNTAYKAVNPSTNEGHNWKWLLKCCELADLVICSSDELSRFYAPHGRVRVLRNCMPDDQFREKSVQDELRLGWSGTLQTHPVDLYSTNGHIGAAMVNFADNPNFYVVGDGVGVKEHIRVPGEVIATGWVPRSEYLETLHNHVDIGVVPLKIDRFNQCKSWLKSLEMSAQGIPSVVSATKENILLNEITGNKAVNKPKEWQKFLKPLLSDRDFYLERSHTVRESVRHLTYENHVDGWIEAWNAAIDIRHKSSH